MINNSRKELDLITYEREKFGFEAQSEQNDCDKENCLQLNNLPLSMRELAKMGSNIINKQNPFNAISSKNVKQRGNISNSRPDKDKSGNRDKGWDIKDYLLSSNEPNEQSPYMMFTPLSLIGDYDSATINPFFHHYPEEDNYCSQKQPKIPQNQLPQEIKKCKQNESYSQESILQEDSLEGQKGQTETKEILQQQQIEVLPFKNANIEQMQDQDQGETQKIEFDGNQGGYGARNNNTPAKSSYQSKYLSQNKSSCHKVQGQSASHSRDSETVSRNSETIKQKSKHEGEYLQLSQIGQLSHKNPQSNQKSGKATNKLIRSSSRQNSINNIEPTQSMFTTKREKPLNNKVKLTSSKNASSKKVESQSKDAGLLSHINAINQKIEEVVVWTNNEQGQKGIQITIGDIVSYVTAKFELEPQIDIYNKVKQSHEQRPRKSISLFSRMMKLEQQPYRMSHHAHDKQQIVPPEQLYLLVQKHRALMVFIESFSHQTLILAIKHKQDAGCVQKRVNLRGSNELEVIVSCELPRKSIQGSDEEEDQEWSSKYITSRRHQTSRTIVRSNQLVRNNQTIDIAFDEQELLRRLNAFEFLLSQMIHHSGILPQIHQPSNHKSKSDIKEVFMYVVKQLLLKGLQCRSVKSLTQNCSLAPEMKCTFEHLLYKLWLPSFNVRQHNGLDAFEQMLEDGSVLDSVFQLLPSHQSSALFILYAMKELEASFFCHPTNQSSVITNSQKPIHKLIEINQNQVTQELKTIRNPISSSLNQIMHNRKTTNKQQLSSAKSIHQSRANQAENQEKVIGQGKERSCRLPSNNCNLLPSKNCTQSSKDLLAKINRRKLAKLLSTQSIPEESFRRQITNSNNLKQSKQIRQKTLPLFDEKDQLRPNNKEVSHKASLQKNKQQMKHSRDPNTHKQHLHMLKLQNNLIQHQQQLEHKEKIIKRLLLLQELDQIQHQIQSKNQQVISQTKLQSLQSTYRQTLVNKQTHINELQNQLSCQDRHLKSIHSQRHLQARLLQQNNQLHMLKNLQPSSASQRILKKHLYR